MSEGQNLSESALIGIWWGQAFPTQATTVTFCPEGDGLFCFYHGSCVESPFRDQFTWSVLSSDRIQVTWKTCHMPEYETRDDDEDDHHDESGNPIIVVHGHQEICPVETGPPRFETGSTRYSRYLRISIGMNETFFAETKLHYCGQPRPLAEELEAMDRRLRESAERASTHPAISTGQKKPWWRLWK